MNNEKVSMNIEGLEPANGYIEQYERLAEDIVDDFHVALSGMGGFGPRHADEIRSRFYRGIERLSPRRDQASVTHIHRIEIKVPSGPDADRVASKVADRIRALAQNPKAAG